VAWKAVALSKEARTRLAVSWKAYRPRALSAAGVQEVPVEGGRGAGAQEQVRQERAGASRGVSAAPGAVLGAGVPAAQAARRVTTRSRTAAGRSDPRIVDMGASL
jgi:hypothetical protein